MIDLSRLNGHRIAVNCDLFKYAEASPDTTITLITGEKLVVRESLDELIERIALWRGHTLRQAWPDAVNALVAHAALERQAHLQDLTNE